MCDLLDKLDKNSQLNDAIYEDYRLAAKSGLKMPHEYVIVNHGCTDNNAIFYDFTKRCKWDRIILKNKMILINFHGDKKFRQEVESFLTDFFGSVNSKFEIRYVLQRLL